MPDFTIPLTIAKVDADQGLVYGWASVIEKDGQQVVDSQGDVIPLPELLGAAHSFMLDKRAGGLMHERFDAGNVVESMVFTPDLQKAMGVDLGQVGWMIGMKVDKAHPAWPGVQKGEYRAFSIGGRGKRTPIDKAAKGEAGKPCATCGAAGGCAHMAIAKAAGARGQKNLLTKIGLNEVSLVDDPANEHARVILVKRADAPTGGKGAAFMALLRKALPFMGDGDKDAIDFTTAFEQAELQEQVADALDDLYEAQDALMRSVRSIVADTDMSADQKQTALNETLDQYRAKVADLVPDLAVAKALVARVEQAAAQGGGDAAATLKELQKMLTVEQLTEKLEKAEAKLAELTKAGETKDAEIVKLKGEIQTITKDRDTALEKAAASGGATEDEITKGMTPAAKTAFIELRKQNKANEEAIAKMRDDADTAAFVKRVGDLGVAGIDAATFGPIMKRMPAADRTEVERVLKALKAQADTAALFKTAGMGGEAPAADSAEAKLAELAKARATKDGTSFEKAYTKVIAENAALYNEFQADFRKRKNAA